jgi:ABC-2 type transport system ATP-binding protein
MDHGRVLVSGTVQELVSQRFHERSVRFDAIDGLDDASLAAFPGVSSLKREDGEAIIYTRDVPATIGALLQASERLGVEPRNLAVRAPTLEDVFLDLTGRALRD